MGVLTIRALVFGSIFKLLVFGNSQVVPRGTRLSGWGRNLSSGQLISRPKVGSRRFGKPQSHAVKELYLSCHNSEATSFGIEKGALYRLLSSSRGRFQVPC